MPAITPQTATLVPAADVYTYTSAATETLILFTQNCRVDVKRKLAAGWVVSQGVIGDWPDGVTFTGLSETGAMWEFHCTPHDALANGNPSRIYFGVS